MINILGNLYESVQEQEIIINEDLSKYGEVENHYKKMGFKRDSEVEDRYFSVINKKIRLFKMRRLTR